MARKGAKPPPSVPPLIGMGGARAGGARRADVDDGVVEAWGAASTVPSPGLGMPGIIPLDIERDMWTSFAAVRRRRAVRLAKIGLAAVRGARRACMMTRARVFCLGKQYCCHIITEKPHSMALCW